MVDHVIRQNRADANLLRRTGRLYVPSGSCTIMAYYQISPYVIFRNYSDFGYITDNRNFGYHFNGNNRVLGDRIVSESGAVILSCMTKRPLMLDEITRRVANEYVDVNFEALKADISSFLKPLVDAGFVICSDGNDNRGERSQENVDENTTTAKSTQAFLEERFGDQPFPVSVHIEIISECNERCVHCYIPHKYKTQLMSPDIFYNLLDQCRDLNIQHITISGGEPMLHKHFIDFLKRCREYDMSVNVLSNLTSMNEDMVAEMKLNPLLGVQTSVYSVRQEVHDAITKSSGSLRKTLRSILSLVENRIPVQISCPIMKANLEHYKEVRDWANKYNILVGYDYTIIGQYDRSNQNLSCRLNYDELERVIKEEMVENPAYKDELIKEAEENHMKDQEDYICSVCNSSICINSNGNVFPCAGWQGYILGNIGERSLSDIWYHSDKVCHLRSLKRRDFVDCERCHQRDYCTVCMVRNSNESSTGNPLEVSRYFCKVAEIKKRLVEG